jgi:hypothetical protein
MIEILRRLIDCSCALISLKGVVIGLCDFQKLTNEGQIGHRNIAVDSRLFLELNCEESGRRLSEHALVSGYSASGNSIVAPV